jgi:hypothetical protein
MVDGEASAVRPADDNGNGAAADTPRRGRFERVSPQRQAHAAAETGGLDAPCASTADTLLNIAAASSPILTIIDRP